MEAVQPLIETLREIATARGKSVAQVSLNWVMRGETGLPVVPIPAAKTVKQAEENVAASEWRLTRSEIDRIEASLPKEDVMGIPQA